MGRPGPCNGRVAPPPGAARRRAVPPRSPVEPGAGVRLVHAVDGREEPLAARRQVGEDELEARVARLRQDVQRLRQTAQLRVHLR